MDSVYVKDVVRTGDGSLQGVSSRLFTFVVFRCLDVVRRFSYMEPPSSYMEPPSWL